MMQTSHMDDSETTGPVAPAAAPALKPRLTRWLRRLGWAVGALLLLWALAWLAVPPLLKWQAQKQLGALLGRTVTLGAVDFRPWSLALTLRDIEIAAAPDTGASAPLLRAQRLHVNAALSSIVRRAPVVEAIELDGLQLQLTRTSAGHYDVDDLIQRFTPASPPPDAPAEPARFALYNLQLRDASLHFDDRPAGRVHRLERGNLSLPFVSNLPSLVEIEVEPRLAFHLNGTPFDSGAQALPFAQARSGELRLAFTDLDLMPYLGYLPEALPVRLQRGSVSADLRARFAVPEGGAPSVVLSGSAGARDVAVTDREAAPLLGWQRLQLGLRDVQPLARTLAFGTLRIEGLQLHVARAADGNLNLGKLLAARAERRTEAVAALEAASASSAAGGSTASPVWRADLDVLELEGGRIAWHDAGTQPAAALLLDGITLRVEQLAWPVRKPMPIKLAATLRPADAAASAVAGRLTVDGVGSDRQARLAVALEALELPAFAPYVAQALAPTLAGRLSMKARLDWSADPAAPRLALGVDSAALEGLRLNETSGRSARDAVAFERLALEALEVDLLARRATLGKLELHKPVLALDRDRDGVWNATRWAKARAMPVSTAAPAAAAAAPAAAASAPPPWRVQLAMLALSGGQVQLSDAFAPGHAITPPVRAELGKLRVQLQDLHWPSVRGTPPARLTVDARVGLPATPRQRAGAGGTLRWSGRVEAEPAAASGQLQIERFPVHLFEPYFGEQIKVGLQHAEANWKGAVGARAGPAGWSANAAGDARLVDVRVHTRPDPNQPAGFAATDELLSWQSLVVDGIRVAVAPRARPRIEVREATLSDFYSRLIITEEGRFNLRDVAAPADAASAPAAAASAPPTAPAATAAAAAASAPADAAGQMPVDLSIGGVNLANGRVDFSDRFVRPNYSANLSELNGRLGAFRSDTREMATLELRGRAAGTALLDIRGALNPTAKPLALDIQAKATDLELAPLSSYSGKYAGYAIERGKLSMDLAYKIDPDGKLEARNQVILNQLTFGEKVDSPQATKLPVLLAVALLKDRHGNIDIDLPVSGSINDPQFSVFGIVLKVIGNLLVKALTAPFSLLAGGGKDDLSLVEFHAGTSRVSDAGRNALDKVAKALEDRPALEMTVTGAADPVSEREAYKQAALEARLLAEHRRELLRSGMAVADADAVKTLDADTRAKVLKEVYRRTDLPNKPRNAIGIARDIPGPEMEALLLARGVVTAEAMRELALQRGLAVREALVAKGLPSERLFLAAPKLRASDEDAASWTPRVQLSLSTN
jgi:uncharacterized protein involved in outer membrane biogenesis